MIKATYNDKAIVVDILAKSFDTNKSVNYVIKQDTKRMKRIKLLMEYSFELCYHFGDVLLSPCRTACALIAYPDKKKTTIRSLLWDAKLVLCSIGLFNLKKALNRESKIKRYHPREPFTYLWFIGVTPAHQGQSIGGYLLNEILQYSDSQNREVYLETSTERNIPFYKRFGFEVYDEINISYKLFFLKRPKRIC